MAKRGGGGNRRIAKAKAQPGSPATNPIGVAGQVTDLAALQREIVRQMGPSLSRVVRRAVKDEVAARLPSPPPQISTVNNADWLGPQQPVAPQAPDNAAPIRAFDYPIGYNVTWQPRKYQTYNFPQLRWLADNFDLLREVMERRKDEVASIGWIIADEDGHDMADDAEVKLILARLKYPDGVHTYSQWQRALLEEMFVTDATTIYPQYTRAGDVYRLYQIDGATITPLINEWGFRPDPPDPAYQQVIKGMPYRDFQGVETQTEEVVAELTAEELIYFPRNIRPGHPVYGFPQVEQCVMTIAWGIKAEMFQYGWFTEGTMPQTMVMMPPEWTTRQIANFQAWFDDLMRGNTARRAGNVRMMPGGAKPEVLKQYEFNHEMWEWLARVVCAAFHVSPQPYVQMMNRATAGTAQVMQVQEGLEPDKDWWAALIDYVLAHVFNRPDLHHQWKEDENLDPAEVAKAQDIRVRNGTATANDIREENGDEPYENGVGDKPFIVAGNQVLLLEDIEAASKQAVAPPPAPTLPTSAASPNGRNGNGNGAAAKPKPKPSATSATAAANNKADGGSTEAGLPFASSLHERNGHRSNSHIY